jgi:hypothetical protein
MNAAPPISVSYSAALARYNEERKAAAIVQAAAAQAAATAPAPQPVPKPSLARRALNWVKRKLCCCLAKPEVEEPQPLPQPLLPQPQPELPAPLTEVPANMVVGFDGKLHEVYNPTSGKPCPHFLTTTNARTGEISCLNCKQVL